MQPMQVTGAGIGPRIPGYLIDEQQEKESCTGKIASGRAAADSATEQLTTANRLLMSGFQRKGGSP